MRIRVIRAGALSWAVLILCFGAAVGQEVPATNPGPVEAELLKSINVRRLKPGATVFARVTRDWHGPDCLLREGATLEGTAEVVELHKVLNDSKLALSFTKAQCDGLEMKPLELLLSAVAAPPANWENVPDATSKTPVILQTQIPGSKGGSGAFSAEVIPGGIPFWHMELKGITHHFPMSAKVQPGDVIEIKGMKLELGTGPNRSSFLSMKGRDVMLDAYTQMLLVPSEMVFERVAMRRAVNGEAERVLTDAPASAAPPAPVNDLETCAPPGCMVDVPVDGLDVEARSGAIAVHSLGYSPRPSMHLGDFTDDEALAWLGPQQLLFTFNAHRLIPREGVENEKATHRIIRAVLLDAQSRAVIRAIDWEITDSGRYLWRLPGDRVLVHVGNELRIYSAGLDMERTVLLAGPLAFVRIAPNGEMMAVAVLRERHTAELHAKLMEDIWDQPEEDVDVVILDKTFRVMARASSVSGLEPPTLLNEGQVELLAQPNNYYRLALNTWDNKSTTLARFQSLCKPQLSSMAPDHLFLMTCNKSTNRAEYRVMRADGKLLMRGEADPREFGEDVDGSESNGLFAVKAVHALRELSRGMDFTGADLETEELRVYRASDGKRLRSVRVDEPPTSHGGYALSPDGKQIAVLSGDQVEFYPVRK